MMSASFLALFLHWNGLFVGVQQTAPIGNPFAQQPGIAATVVTGARIHPRIGVNILYLQPLQGGFGGSYRPYTQLAVQIKLF